MLVLRCQMRRQEPQARQVQGSLLEEVEKGGILPGRPRRLDPVVRRALGKPQDLRAINEEGRKTGSKMEPPRVELRQMRDESRGGPSLRAGQMRHLGHELRI